MKVYITLMFFKFKIIHILKFILRYEIHCDKLPNFTNLLLHVKIKVVILILFLNIKNWIQWIYILWAWVKYSIKTSALQKQAGNKE